MTKTITVRKLLYCGGHHESSSCLELFLDLFTREQLREMAKKCNLEIGRDKCDTIENLIYETGGLLNSTVKITIEITEKV